ncbi:hypothetical protein CVIRNUC_007440 [Coccomyxa viridis]|uniref:4a-hydroxytetrahydrobiopterin dehydratase n=1 Tax=Coccomyxa viridis TaxID=1274662 RepID=A0AAV1IBX7_9CHLO|nr:hypothetical protein CVIRNUC_007440 [Coccomyxa viridis]
MSDSCLERGPKGLERLVGLAVRKCIPCAEGSMQPVAESDAYKLRNQVPGWRVEKTEEGTLCLRQDWTVRSFQSGVELFKRIGEVAEAEGHHPDLHLEGYNKVSAELSTHSIGGLSENDFIMAAKINAIPVADLQPKAKPRFWA